MLTSLDDYLHIKKIKITWFFSQILMIKESCNLIGWKAQLPHPIKKWLPFFDDYLQSKNLRDQSIPSRDIIKKSWARTTTGQSHPPKVVFSDAAFPWSITSCKKAKTSLDSFQRYWWSNNSAIWLAKKHDWQTQPKR